MSCPYVLSVEDGLPEKSEMTPEGVLQVLCQELPLSASFLIEYPRVS